MAKRLEIKLTEEQRTALDGYCTDKEVQVSSFIRETIMREIGRKDLANAVQMGRPVKSVD